VKLGVTPWRARERTAAGLTEQARLAESLGFASFWLPENHFNPDAIPDPLMLLAAVAAGTATIRLATTSYLLPLRHPLQAAEQVAVLDQLSGGRVILGVGRGYAQPMLRAFDVAPRDKRALFEVALARMIDLWSGAPIGRQADDAPLHLDPLPVQRPHPPVWVAAFGPKALEQAGRLGLPYLASPVETLTALVENQRLHRKAVAAAGLPAPAEVPVMRTLFVTENDRETQALRAALGMPGQGVVRAPDGAEVTDWAIVGESGYVAERVAEYRQCLGMTHLIIARLRLPGLETVRLVRSLERVAALFGDRAQAWLDHQPAL
jgi:alkanesulfonate monooxygenase SsuD/methylene tetrahydromethanopterin reductase-like flavin-dependent oxidoreductase (luciferase family)